MKKIILSLTVLAVTSLFAANTAVCAGCHGAKGEKKALGKSKVINEIAPAEIETILKGYKDGSYGGAMKGVMKGQVAKLSDADIAELAKYFGKK
ncbi:MAG TPA: c-type cytochrome [Campylobacterales bacterium]|nr:c-type cytochrome [Campylobacterales bacterium]